ncbi:hypothetical protein QLQ12_03465 [Actinoplanes sp. NEAU-A12]|uniref:Ricin B lectin domain-containing protein n=1 Tax=Actinoplanes sandaracinus TaxID=3045177 RepID=A0ABT6WD55_9ACTN|nr:hypothetical protein [Actinoplanes sandaracinus]MDI6097660.1 hypothetical protein [Actinoplanes sandaracinus]
MSVVARIGALISGGALVLCVSACTSDPAEPAPSGPAWIEADTSEATGGPTGAPKSPGASAATVAPVTADRQFVFGTVDSDGKWFLSVNGTGLVELTRKYSDQALFVPSPVDAGGAGFLLRTGSGTSCLKVHDPGGGKQSRLKTAACDIADAGQIFSFSLSRDGQGRAVAVNGLVVHAEAGSSKVIVKKAGEGLFPAFIATDRGASTLPRLGG